MMWVTYAGKELLRKKIILVSLILTLLFVGLFSFGLFKISQHQTVLQQMIDGMALLAVGLFFAQMIVAFLVFFSSMGIISGEVENGLMLAVLARPIPRWKVYLGKYAGTAVWLVLYSAVLFWAIVLPVHWLLHFPLLPMAVIKAFMLFIWIPLLLLAVSMLGSTYLPMLGNGVACAMLFGLSLFSGFAENLFNRNQDQGHHAASHIALVISMLMPSDGIFRRIIYETVGGPDLPITSDITQLGPFSTANVPSTAFIVYSAVYLLVLLAAGCAAFKRKDIA